MSCLRHLPHGAVVKVLQLPAPSQPWRSSGDPVSSFGSPGLGSETHFCPCWCACLNTCGFSLNSPHLSSSPSLAEAFGGILLPPRVWLLLPVGRGGRTGLVGARARLEVGGRRVEEWEVGARSPQFMIHTAGHLLQVSEVPPQCLDCSICEMVRLAPSQVSVELDANRHLATPSPTASAPETISSLTFVQRPTC